jgi:hypothetical protein
LVVPLPSASPLGRDGPLHVESALLMKFESWTVVLEKTAVNEMFRAQPSDAWVASAQDPPAQVPVALQVKVAVDETPEEGVAVNCQTSGEEGLIGLEPQPTRDKARKAIMNLMETSLKLDCNTTSRGSGPHGFKGLLPRTGGA